MREKMDRAKQVFGDKLNSIRENRERKRLDANDYAEHDDAMSEVNRRRGSFGKRLLKNVALGALKGGAIGFGGATGLRHHAGHHAARDMMKGFNEGDEDLIADTANNFDATDSVIRRDTGKVVAGGAGVGALYGVGKTLAQSALARRKSRNSRMLNRGDSELADIGSNALRRISDRGR